MPALGGTRSGQTFEDNLAVISIAKWQHIDRYPVDRRNAGRLLKVALRLITVGNQQDPDGCIGRGDRHGHLDPLCQPALLAGKRRISLADLRIAGGQLRDARYLGNVDDSELIGWDLVGKGGSKVVQRILLKLGRDRPAAIDHRDHRKLLVLLRTRQPGKQCDQHNYHQASKQRGKGPPRPAQHSKIAAGQPDYRHDQ